MEFSYIYYDKTTGKILTKGEAKIEWDTAAKEKRPVNFVMALPTNLVIENGYVKERINQSVAELIAKSKAEQTVQNSDSLLPPPAVPAPEPLEIDISSQSDAIIDEIIAEVNSDEKAKEKMRNAIIDEIIEGVKAEERHKDAVLDEIIQAVIAEDEAEKRRQAQATGQQYSVNDILDEMRDYPSVNSDEYNLDSIIKEYGSNTQPKFIDITKEVLTPTPVSGGLSSKEATIDIQDPEYSIKIVNDAQEKRQDSGYASLIKSSVIEGEIVDFERTGARKGVKYNWLAKGLIALSMACILYSGVKAVTNVVGNVSKSFEYNTALSQVENEYSDSLNFVNKNKITLDGTFDANGWPAYWIDTKGVAQDILSMPDTAYIASLYLAYNQMDNDRINGPYHNWDDTISHISFLVDETHPTAFLTTAGCSTFNEFLTQAGYIDPKTNEPSCDLFEVAGKNAIIELANNQVVGGR